MRELAEIRIKMSLNLLKCITQTIVVQWVKQVKWQIQTICTLPLTILLVQNKILKKTKNLRWESLKTTLEKETQLFLIH